LNFRAKVEGKTDIVAATPDLVDDIETARDPVEPDCAAVPGRRVEHPVAVVFCGPFSGVADVLHAEFPGSGVP
jgi:hypothetical protein